MNMNVPPQYVMKNSNLNGYQNILNQIDNTKTKSFVENNKASADYGYTITTYYDKSGKEILEVKVGEDHTTCRFKGEDGQYTLLQDFENDGKLNLMCYTNKETSIFTKVYDYNQDGTFDESVPQTEDGINNHMNVFNRIKRFLKWGVR